MHFGIYQSTKISAHIIISHFTNHSQEMKMEINEEDAREKSLSVSIL